MPNGSSWPPAPTGSQTRKRKRVRRRPVSSKAVDEVLPEADGNVTVPEAEDDETGPLRRCIASGERLDPERMIRFVVGPEDRLVPDVAGKLPGRGMWVGAERAKLSLAVDKHLFARAARRAVKVEPDLPDLVERLVERQCLDL